mmetsp:Transcript_22565/g.73070  ORF Transcript_22565/g.73070 Transcript_22565/m.73070 type:complete len:234 (-) Transcript_22565:479-1180(-)
MHACIHTCMRSCGMCLHARVFVCGRACEHANMRLCMQAAIHSLRVARCHLFAVLCATTGRRRRSVFRGRLGERLAAASCRRRKPFERRWVFDVRLGRAFLVGLLAAHPCEGQGAEQQVHDGHTHEHDETEEAARAAGLAPIHGLVDVPRSPVFLSAACMVVDESEEAVYRSEEKRSVDVLNVEGLAGEQQIYQHQHEVAPVHGDRDGLGLARPGLKDEDPEHGADHHADHRND